MKDENQTIEVNGEVVTPEMLDELSNGKEDNE